MKARITLADVLSLSIPERIRLVQDIWDSIAEAPESVELDESERAELSRRLEAHRRDPGARSPWELVRGGISKRS
ncbi:MAG TPA: addiction module protein [Phycisphaerae bacterium]|jgi:putative addiction module component (TIGR02574 family)